MVNSPNRIHVPSPPSEASPQRCRGPPHIRSPLRQIANCIESIGVFSEALGMAGSYLFFYMLPPPLPRNGRVQWMVLLWVAKLIRQGAVVLPLVVADAALGCAVCPILLGAPLKNSEDKQSLQHPLSPTVRIPPSRVAKLPCGSDKLLKSPRESLRYPYIAMP